MLHFGPEQNIEASNTESVTRIGIVVAKKWVKQAVRRNTIKRIAREQFRLHCKTLPTRDVIIRLMRKVDGMPRQALATEIVGLLKKLRHQHQRQSMP